jgi:hypothetical protein
VLTNDISLKKLPINGRDPIIVVFKHNESRMLCPTVEHGLSIYYTFGSINPFNRQYKQQQDMVHGV